VALALAGVLVAGCGVRDAPDTWDASAARAVARQAATELEQPLRVLATAGGPGGPELPWGVRQSLATAGIEVTGERQPVPGSPLLVFIEQRRDGELLVVRTLLLRAGAAADTTTWRVHCGEATCRATAER
jgi:nucleotide-binding universal stress UspA family protein